MNVKIRPGNEGDIPFIIQGVRIIEDRSYDNVPNPLTRERMLADIFTEVPRAYTLVAEIDGEKSGFLIYSFCYFASEGEGIWLTNLYIDPFARKSDLGKNMLVALRQKHPHVSGIYGAIAQSNTIARHYFSRVGAERYDDYRIYGAPTDNADGSQ